MLQEAQRKAEERERRLSPQEKAERADLRRGIAGDLREALNGLRKPLPGQPLTVDGHKRAYFIHLPPGYDGKKALPAVLDFYVGQGMMFELEQVRMNRAADRFDFVAVYPELADSLTATGENRAFTGALLDDLRARYAVDARRVYAAGAGAGGALAYGAARDHSRRIAAAGAVEPLGPTGEAGPERPVPVAYFGLSQRGGSARLPPWVSWWIKADHCRASFAQALQREGYSLKRYGPPAGREGAPVFLYWPAASSRNIVIMPGGFYSGGWGGSSGKADARSLMWRFFEQHPLP